MKGQVSRLPNRFYQFSKTVCQIPDILLAHSNDLDHAAHNSLSVTSKRPAERKHGLSVKS